MSSSSFSVAPQAEKCERKMNVFGHKIENAALYRLNQIKPGSFPPQTLPGKKVPILVYG
jgi:hypothetical protein